MDELTLQKLRTALQHSPQGADSETRDILGLLEAMQHNLAMAEFLPDGTFVDANDRFLALFGYQKQELVGKHHHQIWVPEEVAAGQYDALWQRLCQGEAVEGEYRRVRHDGSSIYIQAHYNPLLDEEGRPYKLVKFATDISDTKLRLHEDFGKLAALNRTQAVIEFAPDGSILWANDNFLQLMGYTLESLRGKHHRIFCRDSESNGPEYTEFWQRLHQGEQHHGEFLRLNSKGQPVWLQAIYSPLYAPDGRLNKIVKFASDITAVKRKSQRGRRQGRRHCPLARGDRVRHGRATSCGLTTTSCNSPATRWQKSSAPITAFLSNATKQKVPPTAASGKNWAAVNLIAANTCGWASRGIASGSRRRTTRFLTSMASPSKW